MYRYLILYIIHRLIVRRYRLIEISRFSSALICGVFTLGENVECKIRLYTKRDYTNSNLYAMVRLFRLRLSYQVTLGYYFKPG